MSSTRTLCGVEVSWHLGDPGAEYAALRRSAALTALPHLAGVVLRGEGAGAWAGHLAPGAETLRPGEGRHTLLLDAEGGVLADAWVIAHRDRTWLIADGLSQEALTVEVTEGLPAGVDCTSLVAGHRAWTLDGPFAWEVLARFDSPGVIGLPHGTWFRTREDTLVLRTSRSGEYGYQLWVPRDREDAFVAALCQAGEPVALARAGLGALAAAALENLVFWPHAPESLGQTPLTLQLQWRLPPGSQSRGIGAVRARRESGWEARFGLVWGADLAPGLPLHLGSGATGRVAQVAPWRHGPGQLGRALLPRRLAHPGFTWQSARGPVHTLSAPAVVNRSLFVRPQRHAWEDQADLPLVQPTALPPPHG